MLRAGLKVVLVICVLLLASCGDDEEAGTGETSASANGGWWLLDAPEFSLAAGGLADEAIAESTGQRWILEYSNGVRTFQLSAWDSGSDFVVEVQQDPEVGSTELDGFKVTLRQASGMPSKDIAPSVGAEWIDGDLFLVFGGGALSETELRVLLADVRRVTREDWDAATSFS
jgi:hypothetical protein